VSERVDGALECNGIFNNNNLEGMEGNNTSEDFEEEPKTIPQTLNGTTQSSQEFVLMNLQDFMARMGPTPGPTQHRVTGEGTVGTEEEAISVNPSPENKRPRTSRGGGSSARRRRK